MQYLVRSVKYFVALCVICVAILAAMLLTGTSALSLEDTLYVMFHTSRYATLLAAIVVMSAFYPRFGFIRRRLEGDVEQDREQIVSAFRAAGFELSGERDGEIFFRAEGLPHRLMLLFEDEIRVSQYGQWIELEGIRRGVARVAYRLDSYLEMKRRHE